MSLMNQPFDGQLGYILIEKLKEDYDTLTIVAAFAKTSGVLRLKQEIEQFRANGGKVRIFVGVDMQGTSYEALINLLSACDCLYIVHSEDNLTTFHPKIYLLENESKLWAAVGSNNLTGGGLWTNIESFQCQEYIIGTPECDAFYTPFSEMIARYMDMSCEYVVRVEDENDVTELESAGYVAHEIQQRIEQGKQRAGRVRKIGIPLFGHLRRAGLPGIKKTEKSIGKPLNIGQDVTIQATHAIEETDNNERIWFETKALTGGSRNILDLSKLGRIISGSAAVSRYETSDTRYILGGIAFFDVEPEDTAIIKDITVNYNGIDYLGCTIKFTPNNGSWRLQLKGESNSGEKIHLVNGKDWLVRKILVFEKIRTDYYSLSVLRTNKIKECQNASYVVAQNGSSRDSKKYGLFIS